MKRATIAHEPAFVAAVESAEIAHEAYLGHEEYPIGQDAVLDALTQALNRANESVIAVIDAYCARQVAAALKRDRTKDATRATE